MNCFYCCDISRAVCATQPSSRWNQTLAPTCKGNWAKCSFEMVLQAWRKPLLPPCEIQAVPEDAWRSSFCYHLHSLQTLSRYVSCTYENNLWRHRLSCIRTVLEIFKHLVDSRIHRSVELVSLIRQGVNGSQNTKPPGVALKGSNL